MCGRSTRSRSVSKISSIATVTSELVRVGVLAADWHPWTVSLHDLRIITELVERPAELLLYLRRRTEPDVTRRFHAVDELDFFLDFYSSGLYVEPDPGRMQAELPQFGEPSVAAQRRFKNQRLEDSDQPDRPARRCWYFHQLGMRQAPAPKPQLNANDNLLALVDAIQALDEPGWLRIGTTLLDAAGPQQRKFSRHAAYLTSMTANDRREHTLAVLGGTRADNSFVLIWSSTGEGESLDEATNRLSVYTSAKKHQVRAAYAAALLFDSNDDTSPIAVLYDNRPPSADANLDNTVALLGLKPIEAARATMPRSNRPGRTTARH